MKDLNAPTLTAGPLTLILNPEVGGSISAFTFADDQGEWPVFRGCAAGERDILRQGSFPLVPFVNRVRDGGFHFRGRTIALQPYVELDPSPLHGHGWMAPWTIEQVGEAQAVLSFRHVPGDWPWAYASTQDFRLDPDGLTLVLTCTNEGREPMPCGLGHHPYFHCGPDTRLDTKVDHAWTIDELVLPVDKVTATGRFDLRNRPVCGQDLDNGFDGWGGRALISDPAWPFRIAFSSEDARFFQVYSPVGQPFFVAEPVTHANAALNAPEEEWPELGMQVLAPGETMTLTVRFDVIRS